MAVTEVRNRGVCAPVGFRAGAAAADIRASGAQRLDVAVVVSDRPCAAAGVFTRNLVKAAPVVVSAATLRDGRLQAVVLNSGNANACTGDQGMTDAETMVEETATQLGVDAGLVAVCSTGVIGRPMPMQKVRAGISGAVAALDTDGTPAAEAIMTTDTVSKQVVATAEIGGETVTVGAMAKGSGMIHPDMATLLAVITTDAAIDTEVLSPLLRRVTDATFNCVTVDADTSTNDAVLLLANGAANGAAIAADTAELEQFEQCLTDVCDSLCEQLVADAEGATKYFRVQVNGAIDDAGAKQVAKTVAASPLVKTAIHGSDPNWGRIVAAAGRSGVDFDVQDCDVTIADAPVFQHGAPVAIDLEQIRQAFSQRRVDIAIAIGSGAGQGSAWGCDLTAEYVHINADYTT